MKNIDFARDDADLYPLLQQATNEEKAFLAEIISGKYSAGISKDERCPLKLTMELQSMGGDSVICCVDAAYSIEKYWQMSPVKWRLKLIAMIA